MTAPTTAVATVRDVTMRLRGHPALDGVSPVIVSAWIVLVTSVRAVWPRNRIVTASNVAAAAVTIEHPAPAASR